MIHPVPPSYYFKSFHIMVTFNSGRASYGTGFFIQHNKCIFLLTVRHLVSDYHLPRQNQTNRRVEKITCTFFGEPENGKEGAQSLQTLHLKTPEISQCDNENDLVAVKIPDSVLQIPVLGSAHKFQFEELANLEELKDYYPGLPLFICGYAEGSPPLNDHGDTLPMMRQCIFATPPGFPFKLENYLGNDYAYLDGYALGGYSGSPVISPQHGLPPGNLIEISPYRPLRIVGMVVRRVETTDISKAGAHAGLTSYVRSTSIRELISQICKN